MAGMTPGRVPSKGSSPQRFTPRASSQMPGSVRRALDGHIDSSRRNGDSVEIDGGRLEVKVVDGGGLKRTKSGIMLDPTAVGDKNRPPMQKVALATDFDQLTTANKITALQDTVAALLKQLKDTGNMKG